MTDIFAYISFFYYLCSVLIRKGMSEIIEYILRHTQTKNVKKHKCLLNFVKTLAYMRKNAYLCIGFGNGKTLEYILQHT